MLEFLDNSAKFKYLSVDSEGYAPNILGISVANPALQSMYFPLRAKETSVNLDDETHTALFDTLTSVPYRIMHNAGHDIISIPELFDLPFVCTMVMGHMVDENVMSKSLDYMHKFYCKGEGKNRPALMQSIIDTHGWEWVPIELMNLYGATDAEITMELFLELLPRYEAQFGPLWS